MDKIILGKEIKLEDVIKVARNSAKVEFSEKYINRVVECRKAVNKISEGESVVYGITTGLGDNCNISISKKDREIVQKNILRSHATSLGEPLNCECVRAIMFVMLQVFGLGHSGITLETLEKIKELLNNDITPYCPKHGSVGYLSIEANIGLVLIGEGKAYYKGELLNGKTVLEKAGIEATTLDSKEGLTIVSGGSSVTAIATLALYDSIVLAKSNDISGSMSLEVLKGTLTAMDERLMNVCPHPSQISTASNIRKILVDSEIIKKFKGHRVQDALSLRCMPQLHGAAKKLLADSLLTIETELNSSVDNPLIFQDEDEIEALMGCNADASFAGIACDTISIALTNIAKISERRIDRMVNGHVSELPPFLSAKAGLNSGLMITQYSAAGILGEMRILSHPATINNTPTSAFQEDYVSMGYNAALKAYECVTLGRYITATEIFTAIQAQGFYEDIKPSSATRAVYDLIREKISFLDIDRVTYTEVEYISDLIKSEVINKTVECKIGVLEF